jgi:hypothetical protein
MGSPATCDAPYSGGAAVPSCGAVAASVDRIFAQRIGARDAKQQCRKMRQFIPH